jgi:hypothetical protein
LLTHSTKFHQLLNRCVLCSQQPATGPYREPFEFNIYPHSTSLRSILILFYHLRIGLLIGPFTSRFRVRTMHIHSFAPIPASCCTHLILINLERSMFYETYYIILSSPLLLQLYRVQAFSQHPVIEKLQLIFSS